MRLISREVVEFRNPVGLENLESGEGILWLRACSDTNVSFQNRRSFSVRLSDACSQERFDAVTLYSIIR